MKYEDARQIYICIYDYSNAWHLTGGTCNKQYWRQHFSYHECHTWFCYTKKPKDDEHLLLLLNNLFYANILFVTSKDNVNFESREGTLANKCCHSKHRKGHKYYPISEGIWGPFLFILVPFPSAWWHKFLMFSGVDQCASKHRWAIFLNVFSSLLLYFQIKICYCSFKPKLAN